MSTYNERYDDALSKAPWVAKKTANQRTLLFKYAPFPERKGYLFAATDLETVYFEALTGTSIPTRLAEVTLREGGQEASDAVVELGFEEQQRRAEESLRSLADAFEGGWSAVTVDAESDDYFDAVYYLRSGAFAWQFNMTEMRGRQPLSFIAKHLLSPFSILMAQDRGVDAPSSTRPVDATAAVLSDSGVARALRRVTGAPPPASGRLTPAPPALNFSPAPTPLPKKLKRTPSPERTPLAHPATPERAGMSQTLPPMIPPSSPTPAAKRKVYDFAAGMLPSSGPGSPSGFHTELTSEMASSSTSPPPGQKVLVEESTRRSTRKSPPPPSDPPSDIPTSSMVPSSTQDPLIPTQQKRKKKRKDKKEEEAEEEAEADKRRAEMKRKMAAGGGGRLGRRRV